MVLQFHYIWHRLQSHLSCIAHILVCVCVFVCASCLHIQEADKRIGASVDRDDEPIGPYFPAVRKAMSGSRAGG